MTRSYLPDNRTIPRRRPAFCPRAEALEGRRLLNAGDLDLAFGRGGAVLACDNAANAVQLQTDGKVLAAGGSASGDFALVRLTPGGALDSTFGSGGRVTTDFAGKADLANDTAVLADGGVVTAGWADMGTGKVRGVLVTNHDFAVACYLPSGALDTNFGNGTGKASTNISTVTTSDQYNRLDEAYALAIQADGTYVLGGKTQAGPNAWNRDAALVRYTASGALDTGFGQGGKVVTHLPSGEGSVIQDLAIQPDGKIIAAGYTQAAVGSYYWKIFVARYNADGTLDRTFGTGGVVTTPINASDSIYANGMALQSDGSIVVAGAYEDAARTQEDLVLARYTATGSLDPTFGVGGIARYVTAGAKEVGHSVAIQPTDGKLVVVGSYGTSGGPALSVVARFQSNGTIDTGFGSGGVAINAFSNSESWLNDVAVQTDGKIIAVGLARTQVNANSSRSDFLIARYLGDPVATTGLVAAQTFAPSSGPTGQGTLEPSRFVPSSDQDLTALVTELIRPGTKRSRASIGS